MVVIEAQVGLGVGAVPLLRFIRRYPLFEVFWVLPEGQSHLMAGQAVNMLGRSYRWLGDRRRARPSRFGKEGNNCVTLWREAVIELLGADADPEWRWPDHVRDDAVEVAGHFEAPSTWEEPDEPYAGWTQNPVDIT